MLKKGKASDNNGIRAEDIKICDNETKEMIKLIFDEVLKQESCTPEIWRSTQIKSYCGDSPIWCRYYLVTIGDVLGFV